MTAPLPAPIGAALEGVDVSLVWQALACRVVRTTLVSSLSLDQALGVGPVLLISETFQHTGSFKYRAALAVALHREGAHLLTASSGNFGAALAYAARQLGKRATVVMPLAAARVKVAAVSRNGGTVDLVDTTKLSRAARTSEILAQDPTAQLVSPFDDPFAIAGNSSLGQELFALAQPDVVVVPVGGGGLSSGIVVARSLLGAQCEVIGAEPALGNDAAQSLRTGRLCRLAEEPNTICDGARTLALGERNFAILRNGLSDIIEVREESVLRAVGVLFERANLKVEPTGALAVAALLQSPDRFAGKQAACIISGGNVDPLVYAEILQASAVT